MKSVMHNLKFVFISYPLLIQLIRFIVFITMSKFPVQKHIEHISMGNFSFLTFSGNPIKSFVQLFTIMFVLFLPYARNPRVII